MTESPNFLDEAWAEVVQAANWYEVRWRGSATVSMPRSTQLLDRVTNAPASGSPWVQRRIRRDVRRVPLQSFPYYLVYVTTPRAVVVAFAHKSRRPGYWARRLGDV